MLTVLLVLAIVLCVAVLCLLREAYGEREDGDAGPERWRP